MQLETERLVLRKAKKNDWEDIFEGASDLKVSRSMTVIPYPYTKTDAEWFIKDSIKNWNSKKAFRFFLELKSEKKVIGVMALERIDRKSVV